jgi:hypothetical protein
MIYNSYQLYQMHCHALVRIILIWYAYGTDGTRMVRAWYALDTHLVRVQYSFGTRMIRIWYACGTRLVRIWYASGTCLVCVWYASGTRTAYRILASVPDAYHLGTRLVRVEQLADAEMGVNTFYRFTDENLKITVLKH